MSYSITQSKSPNEAMGKASPASTDIITKTRTVSEFEHAVHDKSCGAATLLRHIDKKKRDAISTFARKVERLVNGNPETGEKPRSSVQFKFEIPENGIPKIIDPYGIMNDIVREEYELMAKIYFNKTKIPELVVEVRLDFRTTEHDDHNYEIINVVWDKRDTRNSQEIGTTYINANGREAAPLNALFWMQAYGCHSGRRLTNNGMTSIVRPSNATVASMPDLHGGYGA